MATECTMGQNYVLEYGGYTPAQTYVFDADTTSDVAIHGALETTPDYFERYLRMRLLAKSSIQQSIIELRIAQANQSRPMQIDTSK